MGMGRLFTVHGKQLAVYVLNNRRSQLVHEMVVTKSQFIAELLLRDNYYGLSLLTAFVRSRLTKKKRSDAVISHFTRQIKAYPLFARHVKTEYLERPNFDSAIRVLTTLRLELQKHNYSGIFVSGGIFTRNRTRKCCPPRPLLKLRLA